jgi:transposase-like protein
MEIGKPARRRRAHTEEFKQVVLAACREAGASVAGVAQTNELNANQARRWMRMQGAEPPSNRLATQSPLLECSSVPAFVPVAIPPTESNAPDIRAEKLWLSITSLDASWHLLSSSVKARVRTRTLESAP